MVSIYDIYKDNDNDRLIIITKTIKSRMRAEYDKVKCVQFLMYNNKLSAYQTNEYAASFKNDILVGNLYGDCGDIFTKEHLNLLLQHIMNFPNLFIAVKTVRAKLAKAKL